MGEEGRDVIKMVAIAEVRDHALRRAIEYHSAKDESSHFRASESEIMHTAEKFAAFMLR